MIIFWALHLGLKSQDNAYLKKATEKSNKNVWVKCTENIHAVQKKKLYENERITVIGQI